MIDYILYIEKYYEDIPDLFAENCVYPKSDMQTYETGTSLHDYFNKYRMEIAYGKKTRI